MATEPEKFETFAIVEVMGHQVYAGRVTEQTIAGAAFIRVDVPAVNDLPAFSKLLGAGSIFAITPCDEEVAARAAASYSNRPFSHLTTVRVPERLPAPARAGGSLDDDDMEDFDDDDLDRVGL